MELINSNSEIIKDFFQSMERMLDSISRLAKESRPHLNGEKFLSNREASKYLKVSIRTLQEWRDTGVIPYIQIKGKIIYRQSDIERVDIYDRYSHFIEDVMDLREKSDWESDKTPRAYEVEDILYYAHEILLQDDYRISEIEFQENQKYFSEIQQNTIATLMGTLEMTEEEVNEFVKCDRYYDEEETFVKMIFERKGWEYEEN